MAFPGNLATHLVNRTVASTLSVTGVAQGDGLAFHIGQRLGLGLGGFG